MSGSSIHNTHDVFHADLILPHHLVCFARGRPRPHALWRRVRRYWPAGPRSSQSACPVPSGAALPALRPLGRTGAPRSSKSSLRLGIALVVGPRELAFPPDANVLPIPGGSAFRVLAVEHRVGGVLPVQEGVEKLLVAGGEVVEREHRHLHLGGVLPEAVNSVHGLVEVSPRVRDLRENDVAPPQSASAKVGNVHLPDEELDGFRRSGTPSRWLRCDRSCRRCAQPRGVHAGAGRRRAG